jgi:hypothetical protein
MKVKELIEQLQQLDPEAYVFVKEYEGGFNYAELKELGADIILDVHPKDDWWYGRHEYANEYYKTNYPNNKIVKGIVL